MLRFFQRMVEDGESYESGILIRPRARYVGPQAEERFFGSRHDRGSSVGAFDCVKVVGDQRSGEARVGDPAAMNVLDWRDQIFAALKQAEIRQVGYVPDAGHARLIELCRADPEMRGAAYERR